MKTVTTFVRSWWILESWEQARLCLSFFSQFYVVTISSQTDKMDGCFWKINGSHPYCDITKSANLVISAYVRPLCFSLYCILELRGRQLVGVKAWGNFFQDFTEK